ncbi:general secretion pathway protein GspB [Hydrocarboniphaga sp.]|uniref:general secretion pathway protein GspB n=1 Tax=Hydrocarboniphaga sp. TaxID=2033016 RepID=UPI003D12921A
MSFILDALRKAERDRNLGQAPRIEDVALAQERPALDDGRGSRRWLRVAGLLLLVLIAALLVILLLRKPPQPAVVAAAPAGVVNATVRGPAHVASAVPAPTAAEPEDSGPPALDEDADISSLDDLSQTPANKARAEPSEEANVIREHDFIARPATADASSDMDPIVVPQPVPSSPSRAALNSTPTPTTLSALADSATGASATPLSEMPPAYRADFPALSVEVHVWDSLPAKRFVLVNGKRYSEGDTLAQGPRLAEIAQEGLVLEYRGSRVLYSLQ